MDGRRKRETLTDETLGRDLEALLAVEPSPEFVARVRSRVADEPVRARGFSMWRLAVAGVLVAPVVLLFVWGTQKITPPSETAFRTTEQAAVQVAQPVVPAPAVARSDRTPAALPVRRLVEAPVDRSERTTALTLPDVIIEESEKRGFDLLLEELRDGKDAAAIVRAASRTATPGPPWLDINPVVIEPLPQVMIFQGEGQ